MVFALAFSAACTTRDGKDTPEPDEEFGTDGVVRFDFTDTHERPTDLTFDATGKLVVAGLIAGEMQIVRLAADGSLDVGFGEAGMSVIAPEAAVSDPAGVHVLPGGAIVTTVTTGVASGDFSLFTATDDGDAGVLQAFDLGSLLGGIGNDEMFKSTMDDGSRIVAIGRMGVGTGSSAVVARFAADGTLDGTFGGGLGAIRDEETTVLEAVATDGSGIIAVGSSGDSLVITRYQEDGSRVLTFGTGGRLTLGDGLGWKSVAIDASGRILVGGVRGLDLDVAHAYLLRLNADGSTDESFGNFGSVEFDLDPKVPDSHVFAVRDLADGSTLVGVNTLESGSFSGGRAFLVKILANGTLDPAFGGGSEFVTTPRLTRGLGITVDQDQASAVLFGEQAGHFDSAWVLFRVAL